MATKSEGVGLVVRAISFQDFQPSDHNPPTLQTDGQTDGRHAIPRPRICTKVHCAVKTGYLIDVNNSVALFNYQNVISKILEHLMFDYIVTEDVADVYQFGFNKL